MNPAAGDGRADHFWKRCYAACAGLDLEVVHTEKAGDATALARAAGDRLVIAVGGDGTAGEVVNGLLSRPAERPPRVGFLQRGTGADLRRSIAAPRRPDEVAGWITCDRWRPLDAGLLTSSSGRRFFINVADAGIGAEVVRRTEQGPAWAGGTLSFLSGAVISLMRHRNRLVRLAIDERPPVTRRIRSVAIANGAYFGGGMQIAPQARTDDGLFEVVTIGDISRAKGVISLPHLYRGTHERLREVEFARGHRVAIEADEPVGLEADGELAGETPAIFEMQPAALQVIDWRPSGILSGTPGPPAHASRAQVRNER